MLAYYTTLLWLKEAHRGYDVENGGGGGNGLVNQSTVWWHGGFVVLVGWCLFRGWGRGEVFVLRRRVPFVVGGVWHKQGKYREREREDTT